MLPAVLARRWLSAMPRMPSELASRSFELHLACAAHNIDSR
jgi:hypothetical protein